MKKVLVLLSTYNGEKYLSEQLDSILNQENVEVEILIRDDGSTDGTLSIIQRYEDITANVKHYTGANKGPAYSFLDLVYCAGKADYYAFADQDDVWESDKLSIAVSMLEQLNNEKPTLYYSNLQVVDQNLNFIRMAHDTEQYQPNKYAALVEYMPSGCTMVFNRKLVDLTNIYSPEFCFMHDVWLYVIAKILGETVYDFDGHIKYRQHEKNVLGAYKKKSLKLYFERIKRFMDREQQPKLKTAKCFYEGYKDIMNLEDRKKVEEIIYYKKSIRGRMKLLFDKQIKATSFSRDIRNRVLIIAGIL